MKGKRRGVKKKSWERMQREEGRVRYATNENEMGLKALCPGFLLL